MSDTPRTDGMLCKIGAAGNTSRFAEFARELERELSVAGWNAAIEHAAESFASQAGQMEMSAEQRMLLTVAQRIRAMKK